MRDKGEKIEINMPKDVLKKMLGFLKVSEKGKIDDIYNLIISWLQELIPGTACSIFIVDPNKDVLRMVGSSDIERKDFEKATYERCEGKTGYVFGTGKFLCLKNENNPNEIAKYPKLVPKGPNKGKPSERKESSGPFMAETIKIGGDVIGVIRAPAYDPEAKNEFSDREQEVFKTFAETLAEIIEIGNLIEQRNALIDILDISEQKDMNSLLKKVVNEVPRIVGGGGCSVFLEEGKDENGNKKFMLKNTTSDNPKFKGLINQRFYVEGGKGLTAWVATVKRAIYVDDINKPSEINRKINEDEPPAIHTPSVCEIEDAGPLLLAPIKYRDNLIGVIRIPRHEKSKSFNGIDKDLLSSFASQLALYILKIKENKKISEIKEERELKLKKIFSPTLIEACKNLKKIDYTIEIGNFFNCLERNETLETEITNSLENLWKKYGDKDSFPLLEDFKKYEKLLFDLPRYRDHFIHQFQVFLLGSKIIDDMYINADNGKTKNFPYYFRNSLNIAQSQDIDADIAWLIASTYHDIAYPIEKGNELYMNFFVKFLELNENIIENIDIGQIFSNKNYGMLIDQICDLYNSLQEGTSWNVNFDNQQKINVDYELRGKILRLIKEKDHGVLGCLILIHKSVSDDRYSKIIYPAALAIALHNDMLKDLDEIKFEKNPLAFLLVYCDLVQEWGRKQNNQYGKATLENITILPDDTHNLVVKTEIKFDNRDAATAKRSEIEDVLENKLKSNQVKFVIKIKELPTEFSSRNY